MFLRYMILKSKIRRVQQMQIVLVTFVLAKVTRTED